MIKGFHHAAISTPDLERCIEFYTRVIGGEVAWRFGWPENTPEADEVTGVAERTDNSVLLVKTAEGRPLHMAVRGMPDALVKEFVETVVMCKRSGSKPS